jgi:hypothetical protein
MDIITAFNIFIIALVAIFFPFMTLSNLQAKRYLLITAALFIAPMAIALTGRLLGWFAVNYVDVILLQLGVFSSSFAVGYGIIAGLFLYAFKVAIFSLFSIARSRVR